MKLTNSVILTAIFAVVLAGCSKSDDPVTPTTNSTDLLTRKWSFPEVSVRTDAKSYTILTNKGGVIGDDNTITINKGGTYSYLDDGKMAMGKWTLSDKKLVLTESNNEISNWTVNNLTSTDLELISINVNLTKGKDLTDRKIYTSEEQNIGLVSLLLVSSLDKQNGGTIDFTKEPEAKRVQVLLKGKAN